MEARTESIRAAASLTGVRYSGTTTEKSGISGQLSGSVRGILNPRQSYIDARLSGLHFTTKALSDILEGVAPGKLAALKQYAPGEPFTLDGHLSGPAERLTLDFDLTSPSGGIRGAVKAADLLEEKIPSHLNGSLAVNNLNLGQLLGTDEVGECTLRTSLGATLGKGKVHLNIDSLHVDKALIHGYEYSNIAGAGTLEPLKKVQAALKVMMEESEFQESMDTPYVDRLPDVEKM